MGSYLKQSWKMMPTIDSSKLVPTPPTAAHSACGLPIGLANSQLSLKSGLFSSFLHYPSLTPSCHLQTRPDALRAHSNSVTVLASIYHKV